MTEIRRATATEIPTIMEIVEEVFDVEQGIPRWMNRIPEEKNPWFYVVVQKEQIVGTLAAWTEENGETHMGRYVILPELRGQHIGTALARFAFEDLFQERTDIVHMEARDQTVRIMKTLGGEVTGEPFEFFVGNCTPMVMRKEDFYRMANVRII